METIEERAHSAAWQIYEEIGMSKHSVERMEEIITKKLTEQKAIDLEKAKEVFNKTCGWLAVYLWYNEAFEKFVKAMEE